VYPHQTERLTGALEQSSLAALIGTSAENVAYITGFRSPCPGVFRTVELAVFTPQGVALVVSASNLSAVVAGRLDVDCVRTFHTFGASAVGPPGVQGQHPQGISAAASTDLADALASALEQLGVDHGAVGLDEGRLTYRARQLIAHRLAGFEIVEGSAPLASARRVKGPYELECLGRSLWVAEESLDAVVQAIERGTTEREAATLFSIEVIKRGGWPDPPVVAMGDRTAIPVSEPSDRALRPGALVRFDVGCAYKGYRSRVARTAVLGQAAPPQEALGQALAAGLDAAIAAISPRAAAAGVWSAAVEAIRANGLPKYAPHRLGHGIGLEAEELPELDSRSGASFELGEVILVETSGSEVGVGGISVSQTVLVTSDGGRVLNRSHAGLILLD